MKLLQYLSILFLTLNCSVYGQSNNSVLPPSFFEEFYSDIEENEIDVQAKKEQFSSENKSLFRPNKLADNYSINANLIQDIYKTTTNLGVFYRLKLIVSNATAINIYSDEIDLKEGGTLYIYSPENVHEIFKYTNKSLQKNNKLATPYINGSEVIIEYFNENQSTIKPKISINEIGIFSNKTSNNFKNNATQSCFVNINCPQGDDWQTQKNGIVRLVIKNGSSTSTCTGALINNTAEDKTPYILTAYHCFIGVDQNELDQSLAQFRFKADDCTGDVSINDTSFLGMDIVATGTTTNETDFALIKLKEAIPYSVNVFFNGWDRNGIPSNSGTTIHHPSGFVQKITGFDSPVTTVSLSGLKTNGHWRVVYDGISSTAGGSSGAPLFNDDKLIIGTLSGGDADCNKLSDPDYFGKFNMHWDQNGATDNKQLEPWLDPLNTGSKTLEGLVHGKGEDTSQTLIEILELDYNLVTTNSDIEITAENITNLNISLYDLNGKVIYKNDFQNISAQTIKLPIAHLANGIYIIDLNSGSINKSHKVTLYK